MEELIGKDSEKDERLVFITASEYVNIMRRVVEAEAKLRMMENALMCDVPHVYMREMLYGINEENDKTFEHMLQEVVKATAPLGEVKDCMKRLDKE